MKIQPNSVVIVLFTYLCIVISKNKFNKKDFMNVYGLFAVNKTAFNLHIDNLDMNRKFIFPDKGLRNIIVTSLRIHNSTLNILGYIPGVSLFSGCVRILSGSAICTYALSAVLADLCAYLVLFIFTLGNAKLHPKRDEMMGHFLREGLLTGITHIARGVFEAFIPFGFIVNASLDIIGTVYNISRIRYADKEGISDWIGYVNSKINLQSSYENPEYPLPFKLLYLA
jgi:hypothetical protein